MSQNKKSTFQITGNNTAEGWLDKEGHDAFKTWYTRYFVLDAQRKKITYFTDQSKMEQRGAYTFTPASIVDSSQSKPNHEHLFLLTGRSLKGESKSELFMDSTSLEVKNKWIAHIRKAIKGESFILENMAESAGSAYRTVEHELKAEMGLEAREANEHCCQFLTNQCRRAERGAEEEEDSIMNNCTIC
jgi:hypothetical protein